MLPLQPGEDEELKQAYRKMSNSRKIAESLAESYRLSGNDAKTVREFSEQGTEGTSQRDHV